MKTLFLLFTLTTIGFTQQWGEPVSWDSGYVSTYPTFVKQFEYEEPFLVTDLRSGVRYQNVESFNMHTLYVYRPEMNGVLVENAPVVFFIHGGGWFDGYAFWYDWIAQSFTGEMGWITVVADYRLTSDSVFIADEYCPARDSCSDVQNRTKAAWYPDNIIDVADAFEWVVDSIEYNGGDPDKIFIMGHSAGGHLVSLFTLHPNFSGIRQNIKGVVSISGGYDIKNLDELVFEYSVDQTFHGGYHNNDSTLNEASPITYVQNGLALPPFYLAHCLVELTSLPSQKIIFSNLLKSYGYNVTEDFYATYDHVSEIFAFADVNSYPAGQVNAFILDVLQINDADENSNRVVFSLEQNYPNPFNPSTTIHFSLGEGGFTKLAVYDVLGREAALLVNNNLPAGEYSKRFNAGGLPSGVYFYTLTQGEHNTAGKMILKK